MPELNHRLLAEIEMLAWESQLPDHSSPLHVLTVTGHLPDSSIELIRQFVEERKRGIGKNEILLLEADSPDVKFEFCEVGGIEIFDEVDDD